jgi:putative glutamine amidotransferase
VGFEAVHPTPAAAGDRLLSHYAEGDLVFQWHQDTFELPDDAELLATGDAVALQAYRVGDLTWVLQWHFEIDRGEIETWLDAFSAEADLLSTWGKTPEAVRAEADARLADHEAKGVETFRRFAEVMRERREAGPPLVAVAAYHLADDRVSRWPHGGYGVPAPYVERARAAGARTAILAPGEPGSPAEILEPFDAPACSSAAATWTRRAMGPRPATPSYGVEPDRDTFEIDLLLEAVHAGLPTLCICRGMQVLNVALAARCTSTCRACRGCSRTAYRSTIRSRCTTSRSRTARCCVRRPAPTRWRLLPPPPRGGPGRGRPAVSARSADGLVEALEPVDGRAGWTVAVQWHPEDTAAHDPAQQGLFDELVRRAAPEGQSS